VNTHFIPLLLDAMLGDYNRNIAVAREPEVLHLMAVIVGRLGVRFFLPLVVFIYSRLDG
jgi:exportin-1